LADNTDVTTRSWRAERSRKWRRGLPELSDGTVTLRELRVRDAAALLGHLHQAEVMRYTAPCPSTVEGFRRYIRWTHTERRNGRYACYGIIPPGQTTPVGVIQIWPIERDFTTAEWGFALGESYWGTGLFVRSARLFIDTVFGPLGVSRLEARSVEANPRGNGVFRKLGATREGVLRGGFHDGDVVSDQVMWSILASEWSGANTSRTKTPRTLVS
jgi:RimJ/RimL family protein N-acetyltransferase